MRRLFCLLAGIPLLAVASHANAHPAKPQHPTCERTFHILSPTHNHYIEYLSGVNVVGSACDGEMVAVFDSTGATDNLHRDIVEPIVAKYGRWHFPDRKIGDPNDDSGTPTTITAVEGTPACMAAIMRGPADRTSLPKLCPDVTGTFNVEQVVVLRR